MDVELALLIISLLFFVCIFSDRIGNRLGVPALLVFLIVGMLFGPDGFGVASASIATTEAIGTVALCVILFTGGMDTKMSNVRLVLGPGTVLATVGVLLTAVLTGLFIWGLFSWFDLLVTIPFSLALLIAATMSSTDSASVFSILRTQRIGLKHHIGETLELESGANDPMAYVLVSMLIGMITGHKMTGSMEDINWLGVVQTIFIQIVIGLAIGMMGGRALLWIMRKVRLTNESLYPIMILSACIFLFAVSHYLMGNSFLAVYVGGLIIGNSKFTRKRQTKSFFDGLTWLCQLTMFLLLGLLVHPTDLLHWYIFIPCIFTSLMMMFVSRPIATLVSLWPFRDRYNLKDVCLISWVGLKGAVPIIFGIQCIAAGVPYADVMFNVIFMCTLVSLTIQGTTVGVVARKLNLATRPVELHRLYHFDLDLPEEIESATTEIIVNEGLLQNGSLLKEIGLPSKCLVIMVRRGEDYFVPTGGSEIQKGDILLVITDDSAALAQHLMEEQNEKAEQNWETQLLINPIDFVRQQFKRRGN